MVRVGGMTYACDPGAKMGARISDMRLDGKPMEAGKKYRVAGWAPVSEEARIAGGQPIWEVVGQYLRDKKTIQAPRLNLPRLIGMTGNPGIG